MKFSIQGACLSLIGAITALGGIAMLGDLKKLYEKKDKQR